MRWDSTTPLRKPSRLTIARIATWIDAEGSVRWEPHHHFIIVTQKDPGVLYWIRDMLEYGTVRQRTSPQAVDRCWTYCLTGQNRILQLLEWSLPYLFTKRSQVKEILSEQNKSEAA